MTICPLCNLAKEKGVLSGLFVDNCKSCGIPLIIRAEHEPEFTPAQRDYIEVFVGAEYPGAKIRWTMESLPSHVHCHVETGG